MPAPLLLINILGAPAAGRHTTAAALLYALKRARVPTELVADWPPSVAERLDGTQRTLAQRRNRLTATELKLSQLAARGTTVVIMDEPLFDPYLMSGDHGGMLTGEEARLLTDTLAAHRARPQLTYLISRAAPALPVLGAVEAVKLQALHALTATITEQMRQSLGELGIAYAEVVDPQDPAQGVLARVRQDLAQRAIHLAP